MRHQYVERDSAAVMDERLFGDRCVRFLYSQVRERAPRLFRLLTSARASGLLGTLQFDSNFTAALLGNRAFLARAGVDLAEALEPAAHFTTPRRIFERKLRYWVCRPMPADIAVVVSPADGRVALGSLSEHSALYVKDKFFELTELLGEGDRPRSQGWAARFRGGDFAVTRLTPERYHYNHVPVAGRVLDFYEVGGAHHACNPSAVIELATPYSKNRRAVTLIDTDVAGGTGVGCVAMVEVVALMIGVVEQRYSAVRYDSPCEVRRGLFLARGAPKSLYRPGSSTTVLLFEPGRIRFAEDLFRNQQHSGAASRLSAGFFAPLVETEVAVRSPLARRSTKGDSP